MTAGAARAEDVGSGESAQARRWANGTLSGRWPTLLALALAALLLADVGDGTENALLLVVTVTTYLTVAVLERPSATWLVLLAAFLGVLALRASGELAPLLTATALTSLVAVGLASGALRRSRLAAAQVPAAVVFAGAGLLGAGVDPSTGVVVIALGLIAHAAWDALHWRADQVVRRSFAEWCGVLDLTVGIGLLVLV